MKRPMIPTGLLLIREAEWLPNHNVPKELVNYIGLRVSWAFDGNDEYGRSWWVTKDEAGNVIVRAPLTELHIRSMVIEGDVG